jgi:AraC-like DNA-binding protein
MQIYEHDSELGRWRAAHCSAHPQLRPFVRGYLASSSFLPQPVRERHLPSAEIPLVLNFGAPHRRLDTTEPDRWVSRDGAWVVGLHDRHQLVEAAGEREFMVVRLTPLGAHHFLRMPMHLIAGQAVELNAFDPKLAGLVMSRVGAARSWDDRFAAMEALIAERVAQATPPSGLALVWRKLEAADGRLPLGRLASEIDCSHRALIAQFRTCIGATPKAMGRLLRFNRAMRSLDALNRNRRSGPASKPYIESRAPDDLPAPSIHWADIAADCGYFDQSHFIREFRQFAGATPTEFVRGMADVA